MSPAVRTPIAAKMPIGLVLEIADERQRQDAKWGEQNHPNGTGCGVYPMNYAPFTAGQLSVISRMKTDRRAAAGTVTWSDILLEETFEALAEDDPGKLRAELIQLAAVAVQWIQAIDRADVRAAAV